MFENFDMETKTKESRRGCEISCLKSSASARKSNAQRLRAPKWEPICPYKLHSTSRIVRHSFRMGVDLPCGHHTLVL